MIRGYIVHGTSEELLFAHGMKGAEVVGCTVKTELNSVDSAEIELPVTNNRALALLHRNAIVRLYDDSRVVFEGDVADVTQAVYGNTKIQLDGALGWMRCICKAPFSIGSSSANRAVEDFLNAIISQYNSSIGDTARLLELGTVTVSGNVEMDHSEEYTQTLDLFKEVIDQLGGYFFVTYNATDSPQIHYVSYPSVESAQTLELGVNILSADNEFDFTDYASRIYATGKADGGALIDIGYVMDADAEARFGRSDYALKTSGNTRAQVTALANAELAVRKNPLQSLQLTAVDLADIGKDYRSFHVGTVAHAAIKHLRIDADMVVQSTARDYINRANTVITFGKAPRTLTGMMQ